MISHLISTDTRWNAEPHPIYSRYRRRREELDEAFFPVLWRQDGGRTPWLEDWCAAPVPA